MEPPGPKYLQGLSKEELHQLRFQTELYATDVVSWLRWRGDFGGVLPEGYDPETLVSQAFAELLAQPNAATPQPEPASLPELQHQLQRIVRRQISRLYRLKENRVLRNEPDLAPVLADVDDELCSPIHLIPGPYPSPLDVALQKDHQQELTRKKATFLAYLRDDGLLKTLFHHLCDGISHPKALARALHLKLSTIFTLKKRLARRIAAFQRRRSSAKLESNI